VLLVGSINYNKSRIEYFPLQYIHVIAILRDSLIFLSLSLSHTHACTHVCKHIDSHTCICLPLGRINVGVVVVMVVVGCTRGVSLVNIIWSSILVKLLFLSFTVTVKLHG